MNKTTTKHKVMVDNDTFVSFNDFLLSKMYKIRINHLPSPTGTTTDEDFKLMCKRHESYLKDNANVYGDYVEDLVLSYEDRELEVHNTMVLIDKNTGEVLNEGSFVLGKEYFKKKKSEQNSYKYYRDKINKNRPKGGIKGSKYKSQHRYTKVFSKVRPQFSSHKHKGIFSDISSDLSPFENIVSSQKNDGTFEPMSTKAIQEKFNISNDDIKKFKQEAKKLKVIADVKLQGRQVGIRVNPAYAMNGHSFSHDLYDAFEDSPEFVENVLNEANGGNSTL